MCQLTYVKIAENVPEINRFLALLISINSIKNFDGWGIFNKEDELFYKSKEKADRDENFTSIFRNLQNISNTMIHVRAVADKTTVKDKNSHPFIKDNLVICHNGTLIRKVGSKSPDIIDSEDFANILNDEVLKTSNMVTSIQNAYNNFYGKFAFLIYNKLDKNYYAVRGETALLHKADLKLTLPNGKIYNFYIINTEKNSLEEAVFYFNIVMFDCNLAANIKLLDMNTVYKLEDDVIPIGNVMEEKPVKQEIFTNFQPHFPAYENTAYSIEELGKIFSKTCLTIDEILSIIKASKLYNKTDTFNSYFYSNLIDKIKEFILENDTEDKRKLWAKIRNKHKISPIEIYKKYKIKFPYFCNSILELRKLL